MRNLTLLSCVIIFLFGCNENDDPIKINENYVIVGLDNNLDSQVISPPIIIKWERQDYDDGTYHGHFYNEIDSIDLDNDNSYDFEFEQYLKISTPNVCDTNILDDCETYGEEWSYIKALNGFQMAYDISADPFCAETPKNFKINDTINIHNNWINMRNHLAFSCTGQTRWDDSESNGYLGIRFTESDTLYGWIKINIIEGQIQIVEYYLED